MILVIYFDGHSVLQDVPQNVPQDLFKKRIVEILTNPTITQEELVKEYGVSSRTIKRWMQKMDNISYVSRDSNGHWEINDEN